MKLTNLAVISMMSFLMVACGGGGGGSSSPSSIPVMVTPDPVPMVELPAVQQPIEQPVIKEPVVIKEVTPDPNAVYETTAELIAAKSFLIEQEYALAVSYKNDNGRSAYLSVCSEFTEGQAGIKVNYNSCLLRTSIESDYSSTLSVANDKNRLVMAIWYLDDTANPRYEIWENDLSTNEARKFEVN